MLASNSAKLLSSIAGGAARLIVFFFLFFFLPITITNHSRKELETFAWQGDETIGRKRLLQVITQSDVWPQS